MKRKTTGSFITLISVLIFCAVSIENADARVYLTDDLFITGFLRHEVAFHTAGRNPYNVGQDDNHDINLSRTFFQTEAKYTPSKTFSLFAKVRVTADHTYHLDSELNDYNAFPLDVPEYDWTMMKVSEDDWRAEIWELYADVSMGNLWLRLGKQPISWGEMIGLRIADQVNALEKNWHMTNEPEEFENIRIPNWSIRAIYQIGTLMCFRDAYLEGFFNPGDVTPDVGAPAGSPYNTSGPFPRFFRIKERDRRGQREFGFRIGGMYKAFYGTFMYLKVFSDSFKFQTKGFAPDYVSGIPFFAGQGDLTPYALLIDKEYPEVDIYGLTLNYEIPQPIGTVVTLEATWIPKTPFGDATSAFPGVRKQGELTYSFRFDRTQQFLPRMMFNTPVELGSITLQFAQYVREGDNRKIYGPGNSKIEHTQEYVLVSVKQPFFYGDLTLGMQCLIDLDDAYQLKPSLQYKHGTDWYIDLVGVFFNGSMDRPGRLGYLDYTSEVFFRFTYQF